VVGIVAGVLATDDLNSWGWRIPFLLGLPLTVVCYLARRKLPDIDAEFDKDSKHGFPLFRAFREQPIAILKALGLNVSVQGGAYIGSTFIAIYLISSLEFPNTFVYWLTAGVTLAAVLLMPLTGRIADRIGSIPTALIGIVGYLVLTYPGFALMGTRDYLLAALGYLLVMVNMSFLQVASFTLTPR
ncbi:MFS transporter, partial [Burkholderia cenocepacia]|uniref:MFS transporter n=1 Tax=Burkholderia cenocepacia TaxID=95486 RepID=UPI0038CBF9FA